MRSGSEDLNALALDLSTRMLDRQEHALDELRARTGVLLAASSLAASFLGGRAAEAGSGFLTILALGVFVISMLVSVYVLLPKSNLIFALRGSVLIDAEDSDPGGISETRRRLASWIEQYHDANQAIVDRLFGAYRVATFAVLTQVVIWVAEIVF